MATVPQCGHRSCRHRGVIVGAFLGYLLRLQEFRREHRLSAYSDCVGAFVEVVTAGAELESIHLQLGDSMFKDPELRDRFGPVWDQWGSKLLKYQGLSAAVRIVGSKAAQAAVAKLDAYVMSNILVVPPFRVFDIQWGTEASVSPKAVLEGAGPVIDAFIADVRPDI